MFVAGAQRLLQTACVTAACSSQPEVDGGSCCSRDGIAGTFSPCQHAQRAAVADGKDRKRQVLGAHELHLQPRRLLQWQHGAYTSDKPSHAGTDIRDVRNRQARCSAINVIARTPGMLV